MPACVCLFPKGWVHLKRCSGDRQLLPGDAVLPQRAGLRRGIHGPAGALERHLQLHRQGQVRADIMVPRGHGSPALIAD